MDAPINKLYRVIIIIIIITNTLFVRTEKKG